MEKQKEHSRRPYLVKILSYKVAYWEVTKNCIRDSVILQKQQSVIKTMNLAA